MKNILYTLLLFFSLSFSSCSNGSDTGSITADLTGLFFENFGDSHSTTFTLDNVGSVEIYTVPNGWSASVSMSDQSVTIIAPPSADNDEVMIGLVVLYGETSGGTTVYETIEVGKVEFIDLDDQQANSMVVNKTQTFYTFNPNRRGESTEEVAIKASDCRLEWVTLYSPVKYVQMIDGRIGFYVDIDEDSDVDDDDDYTDLIEGNALISALSSSNNILWSWHIWVTEREISEVNINGVTFMDRNIGALMNNNDDTDNIADSYGLFYQWGRKDPFIYPSTYNAAGSTGYPHYDYDGSYLNFICYASSTLTGSIAYTTRNPRYFLSGNASSNYDWLYGGSNNTLWDDNGAKSIYDPSPKGWRVPSAAELAVIGEPDSGVTPDEEDYGAELGGELFMALGRRVYIDGSVQNYAPGDLFAPWSGYYWSRDTTNDGSAGEKMASSLHFYFDQSASTVVVDRAEANYRSTGMQIRCVKM